MRISPESKFLCLRLQHGNGYHVFPFLHPAFDLDRITVAHPFFERIHGKPLAARAADNGPILMPVALLVRVAGDAGVKEREDFVVNFKDKEADIFAAAAVGVESRCLDRKSTRLNSS